MDAPPIQPVAARKLALGARLGIGPARRPLAACFLALTLLFSPGCATSNTEDNLTPATGAAEAPEEDHRFTKESSGPVPNPSDQPAEDPTPIEMLRGY